MENIILEQDSSLHSLGSAIDEELLHAFSPSKRYILEWKEYFVKIPDATHILVNNKIIEPILKNIFRIKFENQIGQSNIQALKYEKTLGDPVYYEVLSNKFPVAQDHLSFFRNLLDDLFSMALSIPFDFSSDTQRAVSQSFKKPTPLFIYYFILKNSKELLAAFDFITNYPHRILTNTSEYVPFFKAKKINGPVLTNIFMNYESLIKAPQLPISEKMTGFIPENVWQEKSEETINTIENKFVKDFLIQLISFTEKVPKAPWWGKIPTDRQLIFKNSLGKMKNIKSNPFFEEIETLTNFPTQSRVLLSRNGYKELFSLYQQFQSARKPIFEAMDTAMDIRDIADLYEMWVFFKLVSELEIIYSVKPVLKIIIQDEFGLKWNSEANFEGVGKLIYNRSFRKKSYSVSLRPDFSWIVNGEVEIVFDAKFRMDRNDLSFPEDETNEQSFSAKISDIYKMHTYRDALKVRSAVALYPGTESKFYKTNGEQISSATIENVMSSQLEGIGAIGLSPFTQKEENYV